MTTDASPQSQWVLAIDRDNDVAEQLRFIGRTSQPPWDAEGITDTAEFADLLACRRQPPKLVLLHASKDYTGWSYEAFLDRLVELGWQHCTVLLTGFTDSDTRQRVEAKRANHGLMGVMQAPLDVERIAAWVRGEWESGKGSTKPQNDLTDFANLLSSSVMVLRYAAGSDFAQVVYANISATEINAGELAQADLRRLRLLRNDLARDAQDIKPTRRARLLDWDVDQQRWVECRLHALDDHHVWYTRDWRNDEAVDEEFAAFDSVPDLCGRFDRLCDYLSERWGFTRVRLYQVEPLPSGQALFVASGGEKREELPRLQQPTDRHEVIPRLQSGGGLVAGAGQDPLAHWWRHHHPWSTFVNASASVQEGRSQLVLSSPTAKHQLEDIPPEAKCEPAGDATVGFGTAGMRLIALLPIGDSDASQESTSPPALHALLALDRRIDHILSDFESAAPTDAEKDRMQLAARGGQFSHPLDEPTAESFAQGPMHHIARRLSSWLLDDHEDRVSRWHRVISEAIETHLTAMARSGGMSAISALCEALRSQWFSLWKTERQRANLGDQDAPDHRPVLNWLFVTQRDASQVDVPAGAGALFHHYAEHGGALPLVGPLRQLFDPNTVAWTLYVEQEHDAWWREHGDDLARKWPSRGWSATQKQQALNELREVKTWVGIRLPRAAGFSTAVMVVHLGGKPNQAWVSVLHLLVQAAKRLYPPFLLAQSERLERIAWSAAVMHEMKTETATLNTEFEALEKELKDKDDPLLVSMRATVQSVNDLAVDYLRNLDESYEQPRQNELRAETVNVDETLHRALAPFAVTHSAVNLQQADFNAGTRTLKAPALWRRVVRVLLHNAFRYGDRRVWLAARCEGEELLVSVQNDARHDAVEELKTLNLQEIRTGRAAYLRLRVGLRSAHILARDAEASLEGPKFETTAQGSATVAFELRWPLQEKEEKTAR